MLLVQQQIQAGGLTQRRRAEAKLGALCPPGIGIPCRHFSFSALTK